MTLTRGDTPSSFERWRWPASWLLLVGVSVVALLSAAFVAITPAGDQTALTGQTWAQFAANEAEVAEIFSRQLVLVGLIGAAFGLLALVVSLLPYRAGERWAWYALWLVPIVYGLVTLVMLVDGYAVGYYYLVLTAVAVVGLLLPGTRYLGTS